MPPHTPIAALRLRVYCQNEPGNIVGYKCDPGSEWAEDGQVVADVPRDGFTSALEWKGGKERRFYYQMEDYTFYDQSQSNDQPWSKGGVIY